MSDFKKHPSLVAAVLGAGMEQMYAIRVAQELGVHVIAFDRDDRAPALRCADEAFVIDPGDGENVLRICQDRDVRFLLPTPMGSLLATAGFLNDKRGWPGISGHAARLCTDKLEMRQTLQAAGLHQPIYRAARDFDSIIEEANEIGWPVVIKPRTGSGSRGVVVVKGANDARIHLDWHRSHAASAGEGDSLVEEWISGPEFGMDASIVGGRFQCVCVRRKTVTPLPFRLAFGVSTPAGLKPADELKLLDAAERACNAIGLDDCLVHVDLVLESGTGRAVVIELGGRPSGFHISSHLVPLVTGVSPVREMIRHYCGMTSDFSPRMHGAGVMRMLVFPEGEVVAISGLGEAQTLRGVAALECALRPGDIVRRADSGSSVLSNGHVIAIADSVEQAAAICDAAQAVLGVAIRPLLFTSS